MVKIVTLNLYRNNYSWEVRKDIVINELASLQPDIIAFQEVDYLINQADYIANEIGRICNRKYYAHKVSKTGKYAGIEGLAILTVFENCSHDTKSLRFGSRVVQRIRINAYEKEFVFLNIHLHHRPKNIDWVRVAQIKEIFDWNNQIDLPAILAGDFNAEPNTNAVKLVSEKFASTTDNVTYTYPTPPFRDLKGIPVQVDYVFYNPMAFRVKTTKAIFDTPNNSGIYASDHLGIYCELEIINTD